MTYDGFLIEYLGFNQEYIQFFFYFQIVAIFTLNKLHIFLIIVFEGSA